MLAGYKDRVTAPATPPTAAQAAPLLRRVGRALLRLEREQVCCGTLTRQQFDTLRALHEAGGLTTSEVAARFGIDVSTASRNLAVLAREGCLRRRDAPGDARRVRHVVTPKGRGCIESLCCDEESAIDAVLQRLPAREWSAIARTLGVLAEALEGAACCEAAPRSGPASPQETCRDSRRDTRRA
jgi:DNA-binding MarR family transcriptional regulator